MDRRHNAATRRPARDHRAHGILSAYLATDRWCSASLYFQVREPEHVDREYPQVARTRTDPLGSHQWGLGVAVKCEHGRRRDRLWGSRGCDVLDLRRCRRLVLRQGQEKRKGRRNARFWTAKPGPNDGEWKRGVGGEGGDEGLNSGYGKSGLLSDV